MEELSLLLIIVSLYDSFFILSYIEIDLTTMVLISSLKTLKGLQLLLAYFNFINLYGLSITFLSFCLNTAHFLMIVSNILNYCNLYKNTGIIIHLVWIFYSLIITFLSIFSHSIAWSITKVFAGYWRGSKISYFLLMVEPKDYRINHQ